MVRVRLDNNFYEVERPYKGKIMITSYPFAMYHEFIFSDFVTSTREKIDGHYCALHSSGEPLNTIDGVVVEERGLYRLEVREGKLFLDDEQITS